MVNYEFILKNERIRRYHFLARIFILFNLLSFLLLFFFSNYTQSKSVFFTLLFFVIAPFFFGKGNKFNLKDKNHYLWIAYAATGAVWFNLHIYWMVIATILFYVLYEYVTKKFRISFSTEIIAIPSILKSQTKWEDLNNAILKDGILTLDYKNNKVLQNEIEEDDLTNEKEFNDFCRQQLNEKRKPV